MERNITLDCFKLFLSLLVIAIHVPPLFGDNLASWLISQGIARTAVPCFFILNGYFIASKINKKKAVIKYILHLLLVYAVWSCIYIYIFARFYDMHRIIELIFNGYLHLWYLPALIIGVVLLYLLKKHDNVGLISAIALFLIGYLIQHYSTDTELYRNGLFLGFPFVYLGYYIHTKNLSEKLENKYLIISTIIGIAFILSESYYASIEKQVWDIYLSLLIYCPAVVILVLKNSKYTKMNNYVYYFGLLPSGIYFIHPLIVDRYIYYVIKYLHLGSINFVAFYFLAIILSAICSLIVIRINKHLKIFL